MTCAVRWQLSFLCTFARTAAHCFCAIVTPMRSGGTRSGSVPRAVPVLFPSQVFNEIRNEHFSNVFGFLSQKARNLQAQYDVRLRARALFFVSVVASRGCCPSATPLITVTGSLSFLLDRWELREGSGFSYLRARRGDLRRLPCSAGEAWTSSR